MVDAAGRFDVNRGDWEETSMGEAQQPGVGVVEKPVRAGWSIALWALLALLAHLALLDAAVETFWSGSPLRWWVSPALLLLTALSVWLWRPGGKLLSRLGPVGSAGTPFLLLLAVLAVTAWLPGGQDTGVTFLFQPTSRLLTVVLLLAVLAASAALLRAAGALGGALRLVACSSIVCLGLYALAALGIAVRDDLAFAALLQGGGLWQRLPRWLQGAFVGPLMLVLLAILLQLADLARSLRRQRGIGFSLYQTTALLMAFVTAVSGMVVPGASAASVGRPSGGSNPGLGSVPPATEVVRATDDELSRIILGPPPVSAEDRARQLQALERVFGAIRRIAAETPRDSFDVRAVVQQVGSEPSALFNWVRDRTYWVPYAGSLRGAVGVLMDRVGNSLDRSLLLAELLASSGHTARLAHGTLSPDVARAVGSGVRRVPDDPTGQTAPAAAQWAQALLERIAPDLGVTPARLGPAAAAATKANEAFATGLQAQANRHAGRLLGLVGPGRSNGVAQGPPAETDHWWVQYANGAQWIDLDPTVPTAVPGSVLTQAAGTLRSSDLPVNLRHRVEVRIVVEQTDPRGIREHVALKHTLIPSQLLGRRIVLLHMPQKRVQVEGGTADAVLAGVRRAAAEEKTWTPVLVVGDQTHVDRAFTTSGDLAAAASGGSQPFGGAAGLFGAFAGASEAEDPGRAEAGDQSKTATAEWIEYVIQVPGQPDQRIRRQVFDLVGPARRRATNQASVAPTESQRVQRGLALLGETAILALPCHLSATYLLSLTAQAVAANEKLLLSMARRNLGVPGAPAGAERADKAFPGPVYDFAAVRGAIARDPDAVITAPNVLSYHRTQEERNPGELSALEGYDVVSNGVGVRPGATNSDFEVRLRQGVLDTTLEGYLVPEPCCGARVENAAIAMAATNDEAAWVVARTEDQVERIAGSPDTRARMAADIQAGFVVVARGRSSDTSEVWWRIDTTGGTTLGSGRLGWGQSMAETAAKVAMQVGAWVFCEVNAANEKDSDWKHEVQRLCRLAAFLSLAGTVWKVGAMVLLGTFTNLGVTAARYVASRPFGK